MKLKARVLCSEVYRLCQVSEFSHCWSALFYYSVLRGYLLSINQNDVWNAIWCHTLSKLLMDVF